MKKPLMWTGIVILAVVALVVVTQECEEAHDREAIAYNRKLRLDPDDLNCDPNGHTGSSLFGALQQALNETTKISALVMDDEKEPRMVRLDTDLDGAHRACSEYLLHDAVQSPEVMNLLKRCKIEMIACMTGEALRLHY